MISRAQKGFTLIELLVVIAIIGLLASVVLAAVGTARNKGSDAAVKSQLNAGRSQGELYASNNGESYTGVCAAGSSATPASGMGGLAGPGIFKNAASITGASTAINAIGAYNQATCNDSQIAWAMQAPLTGSVSGSPKFWCVDSNGASLQEVTAFTATSFACPTT